MLSVLQLPNALNIIPESVPELNAPSLTPSGVGIHRLYLLSNFLSKTVLELFHDEGFSLCCQYHPVAVQTADGNSMPSHLWAYQIAG